MSVRPVEWIQVALLPEVRRGRTKLCRVEGHAVCLSNVDGTIHAIDDLCTHGLASLADGYLEGDEIVCPLHDGRFCVRTGQAVGAPCTVDLRRYTVRVEGDAILLDPAEFAQVRPAP